MLILEPKKEEKMAMKRKTKNALGLLGVSIVILALALYWNYHRLEKQTEASLEIAEQKVEAEMQAAVLDAKKEAEIKQEEAIEQLQIQLLDQKKKQEVEEQRKAEIKAQQMAEIEQRKLELAEERREYEINKAFEEHYVPSTNCLNPSSSQRRTICTNDRRKAKLEFEKKWDEEHKAP